MKMYIVQKYTEKMKNKNTQETVQNYIKHLITSNFVTRSFAWTGNPSGNA